MAETRLTWAQVEVVGALSAPAPAPAPAPVPSPGPVRPPEPMPAQGEGSEDRPVYGVATPPTPLLPRSVPEQQRAIFDKVSDRFDWGRRLRDGEVVISVEWVEPRGFAASRAKPAAEDLADYVAGSKRTYVVRGRAATSFGRVIERTFRLPRITD